MPAMLKKIIVMLILLVPISWCGLAIYVMSQQSIEDLMLCTTQDNAIRIPKFMCNTYLLHFRGSQAEIRKMEQTMGLPLEIDDEKQLFKYLDFLIGKGYNINQVSPLTGFTALHTAVLQIKPEVVSYLLEHGADPNIPSGEQAGQGTLSHLTAIELAQRLQQNNKSSDLPVIIQLLASGPTSQ